MDEVIHLLYGGLDMWCGANERKKNLDWEYESSKVTCYSCLDCVIKLGKECAERLTELPPRVS